MKQLLLMCLMIVSSMESFSCTQNVVTQASILGTWECVDLKNVEHVSDFAKYTIIFYDKSQFMEFLTDHEGTRAGVVKDTYQLSGEFITFGEDSEQKYRVYIENNRLRLTIEESLNNEDIGKSLLFYRVNQ